MRDYVSQNALKNIIIVDTIPKNEVISLLKSSDLAIVPLANDAILDAVPSKLIEAWACEKPVLLWASGESARLTEQAGGGLIAEPGNIQMAANRLAELQAVQLREEMGRRGYQFVYANLTREKLAKKYIDHLQTLFKSNT